MRSLRCASLSGVLLLAPAVLNAAGQSGGLASLSIEELLQVRIVSASQQDESLREAPVPVTVITRSMIQAIGARNLQDVLTTYVPGMTLVADQNEINVAARGIYGSSQQKILVMLDGHRLNSRAYSMANPDYSIRIDLDRVKQIEVLRGPGSSLYGNVALTAVVNVVTESGAAIDGLSLTAEGGGFVSGLDADSERHGLLDAAQSFGFTYGRGFSDTTDLVLWGGWFQADGQHIPISRAQDYSSSPRDGFAHVATFKDAPSYDTGLRYRAGPVTLLGNRRYGKYMEPFTDGGTTGEVYDPAEYRTFQGKGPGLGSLSNHLELKYHPSPAPGLSLDLIGYYDTNQRDGIVITSAARRSTNFTSWLDDAVGGIVQMDRQYRVGGAGGDILAGVQVDRMRLIDSNLPAGEGGEWTDFGDSRQAPLLQPGREIIYSAFTQVKHTFNTRWLVNNGLRLDVKDRHRGPNVTDVSPRLALVFTPTSRFDVKVSYARSFVDAPYWYRYNVFPTYQGSENLRPEHLRSFQITPGISLLDGRLRNTVNVFHDTVTDFVFRDNNAGPTDPKYLNAGDLRSVGVENETAWIRDAVRVRGVFGSLHVLSSRAFAASRGEIFNVPRVHGSMVVEARPFRRLSSDAWVTLNLRYASDQLSPIAPTFRLNGADQVARFQDPTHRVDGYLLADLGLRISRVLVDRASLAATVYNLFDRRYEQGGSVVHPYPQPGRSFLVRLTYRLRPPLP
ncbi:MAG: TonB-dependent receptor [Acidobacteria bacterium]|nr:TonB-dependent receptor [Acidobacteriota bacterium]